MIHRPGTPEFTAHERYQSFRIGFVDGVKAAVKSPRFEGHRLQPDYLRGYDAGRSAKHTAMADYAVEVGHDPSYDMLRGVVPSTTIFPSHEWGEAKPSQSMTERKIRRCKWCRRAYRKAIDGHPCTGRGSR
jgi:hypothetical protein